MAVPANRYLTFFSIAFLGCAADLLTKHWVFAWRGPPQRHNEWWLIEGYVGVETAVNTGALFGMFAGYGTVFAALSIVAALGILLWLFVGGAAHDWLLTIALACVMAGILGNLYDRLGFWWEPGMDERWKSGVRDWILFRYQDYTWPNFNIADSLLVIGAGTLMFHAFFGVHEEPERKKH